jgi:PIN domain nuclease of toxin-antitoxin system
VTQENKDKKIKKQLPQHHADPFDRMLSSQAVVGNLTLISIDNKISRYRVKNHDGYL